MAGEWIERSLQDAVAALIDYRGKTPTKTTSGIPLITAKVVKNGRIETPDEFIAAEDYEPWMRRGIPNPGDVVITTEAPLGEVAQLGPERVALAQRLIALRGKPGVLDNTFLKYLLQSDAVQEQLRARASGSTVSGIKQSELRKVSLCLPPLPEQRAIAHILGTLDDKVEINRRRNRTLEAMARALFKDWFVDFGPVRGKVEGQEPYLPADLWQKFPERLDDEGKPEGWVERPLDEVADFLNGLALQKFPATDPDDSLPVIKIAELRNAISSKSNRASREVPAKYVIKDGDFLFSWSGSLLAKFWTEGEGALNQHLFKVTSERYPMWLVSHWVHHHLEDFQAIAASKATTMGHIQRGHLKAAMTICPPDDVVERMGIVMRPLVEQTIQNELESRSLTQLRDTLMPKLIFGELRIADAEKFIERAECQAVSQTVSVS